MEGDIFVGDLLTMCKLKNTDATSHLHIDQRNIPSAAQISIVANKEYTNKEATVRWKEPEAKKWRFARSFDIFYFLKQIKNNMAWKTICSDNVFFWPSK